MKINKLMFTSILTITPLVAVTASCSKGYPLITKTGVYVIDPSGLFNITKEKYITSESDYVISFSRKSEETPKLTKNDIKVSTSSRYTYDFRYTFDEEKQTLTFYKDSIADYFKIISQSGTSASGATIIVTLSNY